MTFQKLTLGAIIYIQSIASIVKYTVWGLTNVHTHITSPSRKRMFPSPQKVPFRPFQINPQAPSKTLLWFPSLEIGFACPWTSVESYRMYFCTFCSVRRLRSSRTWLCVSAARSLLVLSSTPSCEYTAVCLSLFLLLGIWTVPSLEQLRVKLLWTFKCICSGGDIL